MIAENQLLIESTEPIHARTTKTRRGKTDSSQPKVGGECRTDGCLLSTVHGPRSTPSQGDGNSSPGKIVMDEFKAGPSFSVHQTQKSGCFWARLIGGDRQPD